MSTLTLETIYNGAADLLIRFDLKPTFDASWGKFTEEQYEMAQELFELSEAPKNEPAKEDAAGEMADVLITLCNVLYTEGITGPECFAFVSSFDEKYECYIAERSAREYAIEFSHMSYKLYNALILTRFGLPRHKRISAVMVIFNQLITAFVRMAKKANISLEDLTIAINATIKKNADKTPITYEVRDGQIKKIKPAVIVSEIE